MGSRVLEINVISAEVVNGANRFTPTTEAYVVVSVNGDHRLSQTTPIGTVRGSCCYWNNTVRFTVEATVLSLVFHLKSKLRLEDVDIATFEFSVAGEQLHGGNKSMRATRSLVIDFRDGDTEGVFNFSYEYGNLVPPSVITCPPAYPLPSPPPPPPRVGYPSYGIQQPPFQGYGYDFEDYFNDEFEHDFEDYFNDDFEHDFEDCFNDDFEDYLGDDFEHDFDYYLDLDFED
ncbi:hypothetical protein V6N13_009909 [Hibiscus sabdariffa]|uniref:C2 domain-containing protein n=1 Tax=Hibiscus sabdariffa TaxID=183260 RepID=A0ABR2B254_9ROSI